MNELDEYRMLLMFTMYTAKKIIKNYRSENSA